MRTRIATDLHDDIGSNLSKISLLSGIIKLRLANENTQNKQMLSSISEISRESVDSMNDIVWTISPNRDSVLEMTRRMREFAEGLMVERAVRVSFNGPSDGQHLKLPMNTRRELLLIFKEAVNNAAKYSDCTKIDIEFRVDGFEFFLKIVDDGRGFDISRNSDGNGLSNMKNRAEKIGGTFSVLTGPGQGTRITINAPSH